MIRISFLLKSAQKRLAGCVGICERSGKWCQFRCACAYVPTAATPVSEVLRRPGFLGFLEQESASSEYLCEEIEQSQSRRLRSVLTCDLRRGLGLGAFVTIPVCFALARQDR